MPNIVFEFIKHSCIGTVRSWLPPLHVTNFMFSDSKSYWLPFLRSFCYEISKWKHHLQILWVIILIYYYSSLCLEVFRNRSIFVRRILLYPSVIKYSYVVLLFILQCLKWIMKVVKSTMLTSRFLKIPMVRSSRYIYILEMC